MLLILRIMQGFGAGAERGRCDGVMKVLLPDSMILDPHLPGGVEAVVYDASSAIPDEHLDAEVLVTWAVPALSGRLDDDPAGRQCAHLGFGTSSSHLTLPADVPWVPTNSSSRT